MRFFIFCLALTLCACNIDAPFQDDLQLAKQAQLERDWPTAERVLGRYLRVEQEAEKRWEAWNLLLEAINGASREPGASLECLEAMLVEYEDDEAKLAEILPQLGSCNQLLRHHEQAATAWESYVELGGLTPEQRINGFRQLASVQYRQRHFEAAEETLLQCMGLPLPDHDKIWCMLDLADAAMGREQWQVVADLGQQILESEPDPEVAGLAGYYRGDALEQMGQLAAALEQFQLARENYPNPGVMDNRIEHLKKQLKAKN